MCARRGPLVNSSIQVRSHVQGNYTVRLNVCVTPVTPNASTLAFRVSLRYVCTRSPPHNLRHAVAFEVPASGKTGVGDHLCKVTPGSGTAGSTQQDTTRGRPRRSFLAMGSPRTSTGHISCVVLFQKCVGSRVEGSAYYASAGFVTLLNPRHANVPPGVPRVAHLQSRVTFRIPYAIV